MDPHNTTIDKSERKLISLNPIEISEKSKFNFKRARKKKSSSPRSRLKYNLSKLNKKTKAKSAERMNLKDILSKAKNKDKNLIRISQIRKGKRALKIKAKQGTSNKSIKGKFDDLKSFENRFSSHVRKEKIMTRKTVGSNRQVRKQKKYSDLYENNKKRKLEEKGKKNDGEERDRRERSSSLTRSHSYLMSKNPSLSKQKNYTEIKEKKDQLKSKNVSNIPSGSTLQGWGRKTNTDMGNLSPKGMDKDSVVTLEIERSVYNRKSSAEGVRTKTKQTQKSIMVGEEDKLEIIDVDVSRSLDMNKVNLKKKTPMQASLAKFIEQKEFIGSDPLEDLKLLKKASQRLFKKKPRYNKQKKSKKSSSSLADVLSKGAKSHSKRLREKTQKEKKEGRKSPEHQVPATKDKSPSKSNRKDRNKLQLTIETEDLDSTEGLVNLLNQNLRLSDINGRSQRHHMLNYKPGSMVQPEKKGDNSNSYSYIMSNNSSLKGSHYVRLGEKSKFEDGFFGNTKSRTKSILNKIKNIGRSYKKYYARTDGIEGGKVYPDYRATMPRKSQELERKLNKSDLISFNSYSKFGLGRKKRSLGDSYRREKGSRGFFGLKYIKNKYKKKKVKSSSPSRKESLALRKSIACNKTRPSRLVTFGKSKNLAIVPTKLSIKPSRQKSPKFKGFKNRYYMNDLKENLARNEDEYYNNLYREHFKQGYYSLKLLKGEKLRNPGKVCYLPRSKNPPNPSSSQRQEEEDPSHRPG